MDQELLTAFERYKAELLSFMTNRLSSPDLAEDLLHDLFIKLDSYVIDKKINAPRAFLYRAANNLIADHYRAQARRDRKHEDSAAPGRDETDSRTPEHIALQRERLAVLQETINALPEKCREVFKLRRFEELEKSDIAKRLNISTNMVEKHLRKALDSCQKALANRLDGED